MKIVCPSCGADYRMSEDKIPSTGLAIRCPSCRHNFTAFPDGRTVSSEGKFAETGAPPNPPPPPIELEDDDFDFAPGGGLLAPPSASDTNVDIESAPYTAGLDSLDPAAAPFDEFAPPDPVNLDPSSGSSSSAEVDDFDFSFGAADPKSAPPAASGPLESLFDDLDDLPAAKPQKTPDPITDLPKPRSEIPSYSFDAVDNLPGLRNEPGEPEVSDSPSPADPAPEALVAPEKPMTDAPAAGPLPPLPNDPHMVSSTVPTAPVDGKKKSRLGLLLVLILLGAGILVVGIMMNEGVGPFAPPVDQSVTAKKPKKKKKKPVRSEMLGESQITVGTADKDGIVPVSAPTRAEIEGYRARIGEEQKDDVVGPARAYLVTLYSFGSMDYPERKDWAKKAAQLAKKMGKDGALTPAEEKARIASDLANDTEGSIERAEKYGETNPQDAEALQILGYARLNARDQKAAQRAFSRAYTKDSNLLAAQRNAALIAHQIGQTETASKILEDLYLKAAGAPPVNNTLAAIELHRGNLKRSRQLLNQVIDLDKGGKGPRRVRGQDRSKSFLLRARLAAKEGDTETYRKDLESAVKSWGNNTVALSLLSQEYLKDRKYDDAIDLLKSIDSKSRPRRPATVIEIAKCYQRSNRTTEARTFLQSALKDKKLAKSEAIYLELGAIFQAEQLFKKAKLQFDKALEINPKSSEARIRIAQLLLRQTRIDESLQFLEDAAKEDPNNPTIHAGIGDLYKRMGMTTLDQGLLTKAEQSYETALSKDETLVDTRLNLALVQVAMGQADKGLKGLESLRARPDFHGNIELELAKANAALGNYEVAIDNYKKVSESDPQNMDVQRSLAMAYFNHNDLVNARKLLERIERTFAKDPDFQVTLGHIDFRQGRFDASSKRFQSAVKLNKKSYTSRYWLGRALKASQKPEVSAAAEEEFRRVTDAMAKDKNLSNELCDAHRQYADYLSSRLADWKDAEAELSRFLECQADSADGWYARGRVRADLQRISGAIKDFEKAASLDSSMGKAFAENAYLRIRNRDHNKKTVESLLKKAIRANADLARPHYLLCNMVKAKNRAQAKRYCKRYLDLAPKGDNASEASELLRSL